MRYTRNAGGDNRYRPPSPGGGRAPVRGDVVLA